MRLQQSLRPILYSLQVHTHLTLNLLNGMRRLLKLLGNHFNETLGEKLVDHLKKWLEPEKLAAAHALRAREPSSRVDRRVHDEVLRPLLESFGEYHRGPRLSACVKVHRLRRRRVDRPCCSRGVPPVALTPRGSSVL